MAQRKRSASLDLLLATGGAKPETPKRIRRRNGEIVFDGFPVAAEEHADAGKNMVAADASTPLQKQVESSTPVSEASAEKPKEKRKLLTCPLSEALSYPGQYEDLWPTLPEIFASSHVYSSDDEEVSDPDDWCPLWPKSTARKDTDDSVESSHSLQKVCVVAKFTCLDVANLKRQGAEISVQVQEWIDRAYMFDERKLKMKTKMSGDGLVVKVKMP